MCIIQDSLASLGMQWKVTPWRTFSTQASFELKWSLMEYFLSAIFSGVIVGTVIFVEFHGQRNNDVGNLVSCFPSLLQSFCSSVKTDLSLQSWVILWYLMITYFFSSLLFFSMVCSSLGLLVSFFKLLPSVQWYITLQNLCYEGLESFSGWWL